MTSDISFMRVSKHTIGAESYHLDNIQGNATKKKIYYWIAICHENYFDHDFLSF